MSKRQREHDKWLEEVNARHAEYDRLHQEHEQRVVADMERRYPESQGWKSFGNLAIRGRVLEGRLQLGYWLSPEKELPAPMIGEGI